MYCGRPAELRWYRVEVHQLKARANALSTPHLCCKACGAALGYWAEVLVDWERVRIDDELSLVVEEDLKTPRRDPFKRRCYDGRMCYCAPFEETYE